MGKTLVTSPRSRHIPALRVCPVCRRPAMRNGRCIYHGGRGSRFGWFTRLWRAAGRVLRNLWPFTR